MNAIDNPNIHRYLDEAFAGIAMTPEIQDLKEEIRGNLAARVLYQMIRHSSFVQDVRKSLSAR